MTRFPTSLRRIADMGLRSLEAHPLHHYDWWTRRDLYHTIATTYPVYAGAFRGWLVITTANYVLPIFTQAISDDDLPQQLVAYAAKIVQHQRKAHSARVSYLLDQGYLCTGIDCLTWRTVTAYNAEYAGTTAYKALLEVREQEAMFGDIDQGIKRGWITVLQPGSHNAHPITAYDVTDADIAHLAAYGDTAGCAAIAYACAAEQFTLDKDKLRAFWYWWVDSALPYAWHQAQQTSVP